MTIRDAEAELRRRGWVLIWAATGWTISHPKAGTYTNQSDADLIRRAGGNQ